MFSNKKKTAFYILAVFFVALDRFLKFLALNRFTGDSTIIIKDFFKFQFASNPNIAFSIPLRGYFLNILIIFLVLWLVYYYLYSIKRKQEINALLLFFIILGALSNLLDRLKFGYVVDYFDFRYFTVFNLADVMIAGGAIGIIWLQIYKKESQ